MKVVNSFVFFDACFTYTGKVHTETLPVCYDYTSTGKETWLQTNRIYDGIMYSYNHNGKFLIAFLVSVAVGRQRPTQEACTWLGGGHHAQAACSAHIKYVIGTAVQPPEVWAKLSGKGRKQTQLSCAPIFSLLQS